MRIHIISFFLVAFDLINAVKVSIYYEALCPDSGSFISNQLYPSYEQFKRHLDIDFIPYGKAMHAKLRNGKWLFNCQHGYQECKANKFQACALTQDLSQEVKLKFVNCVMTSPDPSSLAIVENCARNQSIHFENVKSCMTSERGDDLMAANGDRTFNLEPSLRSVPTILFDGKFDAEVQDKAQMDFVAVICSKIGDSKPGICYDRLNPRN